MTRALLVLALLLLPLPARASPVTFAFTAGALSGQYTFETATPGIRQLSDVPDLDDLERIGGLRHFNAITNFEVRLGAQTWVGSNGDVELGLNRGRFGETWYIADLRTPGLAPDLRLLISVWSPFGDNIIDTEALTNRVPDFVNFPTEKDAFLFNGVSYSHELDSLSRTRTTEVPEPSSALLLGLAVSALGLVHHRRFPKPRGRRL